MRRPAIPLLLAAALAACNDYTFNPIGHCLIQPGTTTITLENVSTVDILFVVDDSPSMDPKQDGLAASFKDFITRMVQTNTQRVSRGLEPLDFHIAITTSSIFYAYPTQTSCVGASGGAQQCCATTSCTNVPACTPGTTAGCTGGQTCVTAPVMDTSQSSVLGAALQCCDVSQCSPAKSACVPGDRCPQLSTSYPSPFPSSSFCTPGVATAGAPYPAGQLVAAGGNPKVLDFDKTLQWASWGSAAPDPALTGLVTEFQQNVKVGSCGSGEEQHLEAARLAMQKALAGQQPGVASGTWPHAGAKLVVVWVGDEDDCSSPIGAPLVMMGSVPGADSCVYDKRLPVEAEREFHVQDYADFFAGLVRPGGAADLGAAFIVSSARCADGTYAAADSCSGTPLCPVNPPATCSPPAGVCSGAYAAGERFFALADAFKSRGIEVVEGTVCDAYPPNTFGPTLSAIADLARPPSAMKLPTRPADSDVTVLRIVDAQGKQRKMCTPGTDWCFVDCADRSATPACLAGGTSECVTINHATGGCEANPGDTYSAEYLGFVPAGGCAVAADCAAALGGAAADWSCYASPSATRGTCLCQARK